MDLINFVEIHMYIHQGTEGYKNLNENLMKLKKSAFLLIFYRTYGRLGKVWDLVVKKWDVDKCLSMIFH